MAEVWERVPEVWVQPWYVLVTAYEPSNPMQHRLKDSLPLVDIEEESLFYSPFWELIYVVVPEDTPPDRYTSATALLSAGLPMHPAAACWRRWRRRTCCPRSPRAARSAAPAHG